MKKRLRLAVWPLLGVVAACVVVATAGRAGADSGVHFVDQRSATVYLNQDSSIGWRVEVFNGDTAKAISVTLVASPDGLLAVDSPSTIDVPPSKVGIFNVRSANTAGPGQLTVYASDGTIDHRGISVVALGGELTLPEELSFTGLHLAPWSRRVHLPPVVLVGTPAGTQTVAVGTLTAPSGRTGQVVLAGNNLVVQGIHAAGDYRGLATLPDGRTVKVHAQIHDAIGLPLLVLLLGLAAVGFLDRYNKQDRPGQILALDLARLRADAAAAQAAAETRLATLPPVVRPASVHRITDPTQERRLLLDHKVDHALGLWKTALDDAVRAPWAEGGPALTEVHKFVEDFAHLHDDVVRLGGQLSDLLTRLSAAPGPDTPIRRAYTSAATPRDLTTDAELLDLKTAIALAQSRLGQFKRLLDHLLQIKKDTGDAQIRDRATHLLDLLCGGAEQDDIDYATEQLAKDAALAESSDTDRDIALQPEGTAPTVSLLEVDPARAPVLAAVASRHHPRLSVALTGAALGVVAMIAAVVGITNIGAYTPQIAARLPVTSHLVQPPGYGAAPVAGGGGPPVAGAEGPAVPQAPDLPVGPSTGSSPAAFSSSNVSIVEAELRGAALPVAAGAAFVALALLAIRWRRGQSADQIDRQSRDPTTLSKTLRRDQRRFSLLSGLLVVLTGLSTLYFTNPTFGSMGDYAKVLLWGSGVGEGIQLARRILPSVPT